jgi:flagellin
MSLTLASNLLSLRVQTGLQRSSNDLARVYERASSGLRINKGSDDPAGLGLADTLKSQSAMLGVANRNANDGISFASLADSGLQEITNILSRMSELATQGGNSTYTTVQRAAFQSELSYLGSEVDRIVNTLSFNSQAILTGNSPSIQVGYDNTNNSRISIGGVTANLSALSLGSGSTLNFSIYNSATDTLYTSITASRAAYTAISNAIDSITIKRGTVTGNLSRLQSALNTITVTRENLMTAEANTRNTDVAQDAAEILRLQILQQAQTSLLAQANQNTSLVLQLLQ